MDSWHGWPRRAGARYSSAVAPRAACDLQSRSRPSSRASIAVRAQLSFAAADRLHRSAEFLRLQRNGVRFQSPNFVLYAGNLDHDPTRSRLGITVSRRVGNAVVRNRVKRRVREFFRKVMRAELPPRTSIVVIARSSAGALESAAIGDELAMAARNISGRIVGRGDGR